MKTRYFPLLVILTFLSLFTASNTFANNSQPFLADYVQAALPLNDTLGIDTLAFTRVDVEATFPGGDASWIQFIQNNLKADIPVRRKAPAGKYTVVVQFIVDKKGDLSDILALTSFGYGMEAEVMRVIRKSPRWLPAQMNGGPVKAYRKQPITFEVTEVSK
jgi:hypothetical protein